MATKVIENSNTRLFGLIFFGKMALIYSKMALIYSVN